MRSDLERANKWTKSSMIVTHLGNNTRNIKTGIGYEQPINRNLCFVLFVVTQVTLNNIVLNTKLLEKIIRKELMKLFKEHVYS